ncbi:MAG: hypothetical protein Q8910_10855 [Bacteroidota bacterium]|nr:hypothetical protein [Bacteroidota bacterium]
MKNANLNKKTFVISLGVEPVFIFLKMMLANAINNSSWMNAKINPLINAFQFFEPEWIDRTMNIPTREKEKSIRWVESFLRFMISLIINTATEHTGLNAVESILKPAT